MGSQSQFTCKCGYETQVSGGEDVGFSVRTCTMTCIDCQEVVDIIIGPPMPDMPLNDELKDLVGKCPICKNTNLTQWPISHPCPRCTEPMQNEGVVILWD